MEQEILQKLGFTQAEAKVYLTLIKLGPVKVGQIIEKSGLQSSTVHNTLHSLIDKGFVNYVLRGKIKIYQSVEPKLILQEFREREEKFENILPKLELMQRLTKEKTVAEIYEGVHGIMTMLNELIEDSKANDIYYFFAVDVKGKNKEIQNFFKRYDAKRKEKKLIIRGLARKELKRLFKNRGLNVRYTDFPIPSNISICNNKMVLIDWKNKPVGILIKSRELTEGQIRFFNEVWKIAKK